MPFFHVARVEPKIPPILITDDEGKPLTWESAEQAAEFAQYEQRRLANRPYYLSEADWKKHPASKIKFQPRPIADDAWKQRETDRFTNGEYLAVPATWPTSSLPVDHFLHVSVKEPTRVAFTESPLKGAQDRQTSMLPGRYLQKFAGHILSGPDIAKLAAEFGAIHGEEKVEFASTPDDIEEVYLNGPDSCMSHDEDHYASPFHPVRVYGAGDLAVAYLKRDDNITARCLCWPTKKLYSRVYGDESRLIPLLEDLGFSEGRLTGARLLRHAYDGGFVAPYIDTTPWVRDNGKHLIICSSYDDTGDSRRYCCDSSEGIVGTDGSDNSEYNVECYECGDSYHEDDVRYVEALEGSFCSHCFRTYTFECFMTSERHHIDERVVLYNRRYVSQRWFEANGGICDEDGKNYPISELVELHDGTMWNEDYFASRGGLCVSTDENYPLEKLIRDDNDDYYEIEEARRLLGICHDTWAVLPLTDLTERPDGTFVTKDL